MLLMYFLKVVDFIMQHISLGIRKKYAYDDMKFIGLSNKKFIELSNKKIGRC